MSDALKTPARSRAPSDPPTSVSRLTGLPLKSPMPANAHSSSASTSEAPNSVRKAQPKSVVENIASLGSILTNASSTWEDRAKSMVDLEALIASEEVQTIRSDEIKFPQLVQQLQTSVFAHISTQILDPRAQVCRDACKLVSGVASSMGGQGVDGMILNAVPVLMKTLGSPKKVFVNFADNAMLSVMKECDYRQVVAEVVKGTADKNAVLRQHSFHYMLIGLKKYDAELLEKDEHFFMDKMVAAMKEGVADSKSEVRQNASACIGILQTKFPHLYEALIASLDPTSLKQLTAVLKSRTKPSSTDGASASSSRPSSFVRPTITKPKTEETENKQEDKSEEKTEEKKDEEEKEKKEETSDNVTPPSTSEESSASTSDSLSATTTTTTEAVSIIAPNALTFNFAIEDDVAPLLDSASTPFIMDSITASSVSELSIALEPISFTTSTPVKEEKSAFSLVDSPSTPATPTTPIHSFSLATAASESPLLFDPSTPKMLQAITEPLSSSFLDFSPSSLLMPTSFEGGASSTPIAVSKPSKRDSMIFSPSAFTMIPSADAVAEAVAIAIAESEAIAESNVIAQYDVIAESEVVEEKEAQTDETIEKIDSLVSEVAAEVVQVSEEIIDDITSENIIDTVDEDEDELESPEKEVETSVDMDALSVAVSIHNVINEAEDTILNLSKSIAATQIHIEEEEIKEEIVVVAEVSLHVAEITEVVEEPIIALIETPVKAEPSNVSPVASPQNFLLTPFSPSPISSFSSQAFEPIVMDSFLAPTVVETAEEVQLDVAQEIVIPAQEDIQVDEEKIEEHESSESATLDASIEEQEKVEEISPVSVTSSALEIVSTAESLVDDFDDLPELDAPTADLVGLATDGSNLLGGDMTFDITGTPLKKRRRISYLTQTDRAPLVPSIIEPSIYSVIAEEQSETITEQIEETDDDVDIVTESSVVDKSAIVEFEEDATDDDVAETVDEIVSEVLVASNSPVQPAETPMTGALRVIMQQHEDEDIEDEDEEEEDISLTSLSSPAFNTARHTSRKMSLSTIDEMSEPSYTPLASPMDAMQTRRVLRLSAAFLPSADQHTILEESFHSSDASEQDSEVAGDEIDEISADALLSAAVEDEPTTTTLSTSLYAQFETAIEAELYGAEDAVEKDIAVDQVNSSLLLTEDEFAALEDEVDEELIAVTEDVQEKEVDAQINASLVLSEDSFALLEAQVDSEVQAEEEASELIEKQAEILDVIEVEAFEAIEAQIDLSMVETEAFEAIEAQVDASIEKEAEIAAFEAIEAQVDASIEKAAELEVFEAIEAQVDESIAKEEDEEISAAFEAIETEIAEEEQAQVVEKIEEDESLVAVLPQSNVEETQDIIDEIDAFDDIISNMDEETEVVELVAPQDETESIAFEAIEESTSTASEIQVEDSPVPSEDALFEEKDDIDVATPCESDIEDVETLKDSEEQDDQIALESDSIALVDEPIAEIVVADIEEIASYHVAVEEEDEISVSSITESSDAPAEDLIEALNVTPASEEEDVISVVEEEEVIETIKTAIEDEETALIVEAVSDDSIDVSDVVEAVEDIAIADDEVTMIIESNVDDEETQVFAAIDDEVDDEEIAQVIAAVEAADEEESVANAIQDEIISEEEDHAIEADAESSESEEDDEIDQDQDQELSVNESVNESINESINESVNESVNDSINESVNESVEDDEDEVVEKPVRRTAKRTSRAAKASTASAKRTARATKSKKVAAAAVVVVAVESDSESVEDCASSSVNSEEDEDNVVEAPVVAKRASARGAAKKTSKRAASKKSASVATIEDSEEDEQEIVATTTESSESANESADESSESVAASSEDDQVIVKKTAKRGGRAKKSAPAAKKSAPTARRSKRSAAVVESEESEDDEDDVVEDNETSSEEDDEPVVEEEEPVAISRAKRSSSRAKLVAAAPVAPKRAGRATKAAKKASVVESESEDDEIAIEEEEEVIIAEDEEIIVSADEDVVENKRTSKRTSAATKKSSKATAAAKKTAKATAVAAEVVDDDQKENATSANTRPTRSASTKKIVASGPSTATKKTATAAATTKKMPLSAVQEPSTPIANRVRTRTARK